MGSAGDSAESLPAGLGVDFRVLRGLGMAGCGGRVSASTGKLAVDEAMIAAGTVHTDKGVGTGS